MAEGESRTLSAKSVWAGGHLYDDNSNDIGIGGTASQEKEDDLVIILNNR